MTYKDNQPTFNVNRKVVNFKDFSADSEKDELKKMNRQNKPNSDEYQKNFANSRYKFNKVTRKMDDLSPAEIEDKIDAIEELEGTNEGQSSNETYIVTIDYPVRAYREYIIEAKNEQEALRIVKSGEADDDSCVTNTTDVDYKSPKFSAKIYTEE